MLNNKLLKVLLDGLRCSIDLDQLEDVCVVTCQDILDGGIYCIARLTEGCELEDLALELNVFDSGAEGLATASVCGDNRQKPTWLHGRTPGSWPFSALSWHPSLASSSFEVSRKEGQQMYLELEPWQHPHLIDSRAVIQATLFRLAAQLLPFYLNKETQRR